MDTLGIHLSTQSNHEVEWRRQYAIQNLGLGYRYTQPIADFARARLNIAYFAGRLAYAMEWRSVDLTQILGSQDTSFLGKTVTYYEQIEHVTLHGLITGPQAGLSLEIDFLREWQACLSVSAKSLFAIDASGLSRRTTTSMQRNGLSPDEPMTTAEDEYEAAFVKGNFLGTGEFVSVEDPNRKTQDPQGRNVPIERTWVEFSFLKLSFTITKSF
jgi:hypothetical protein